MNTETEISPIIPTDKEIQRMMEIRFDCLVKMFDSGYRTVKSNIPLVPPKHLPPQWFKLEKRFTMEMIKESNPYELGCLIKEAFFELERHIEQYTK